MTLRLLISLSLLLLAWQRAGAQLAPAEDFFNGGAQAYISNNIPAALERVEMGRKIYPDDEKLKKLEQLLKQQQQQQSQQQKQDQSQQNQQQQQSKDDQKKDQQNQSQSSKDQESQQKQEDQKQKDAAEKKDELPKDQDQKKSADEKQKDEQKDKPEGQAQPVKPGEMTPEEAKQLLDAQKGNEQMLQWKPGNKPRNPQRPLKDW